MDILAPPNTKPDVLDVTYLLQAAPFIEKLEFHVSNSFPKLKPLCSSKDQSNQTCSNYGNDREYTKYVDNDFLIYTDDAIKNGSLHLVIN